MNTDRSRKKALEFLNNGPKFSRKVIKHKRHFSSTPEEVFFQFCPSRELDWIDGWDCDLLYTSTGYVEAGCIFSTPERNGLGPGLWVFTDYKPNERLQIVRFIENSIVENFSIQLQDNGDGTCVGLWTLMFTGVNKKGSEFVAAMPDRFRNSKQPPPDWSTSSTPANCSNRRLNTADHPHLYGGASASPYSFFAYVPISSPAS